MSAAPTPTRCCCEDGPRRACGQDPDDRDVTGGIVAALELLGGHPEVARGGDRRRRDRHDAFRQRRRAAPAIWRAVAAMRIGLPASASLPPFCDWPADLAALGPRRRLHARRRARLRRPPDHAVRRGRHARRRRGRSATSGSALGRGRRGLLAARPVPRGAGARHPRRRVPGRRGDPVARSRPHRPPGARERRPAQCRARRSRAGHDRGVSRGDRGERDRGAAVSDAERRHRDVGRDGDGAAGHELCLGRDQFDARRRVSVGHRRTRWSSMSAAPRPMSGSCAAASRARPIRSSRSAGCAPCSACRICCRSGSAAAASSTGTPLAVGPQSVGYRLTEEALVFGGTDIDRDRCRGRGRHRRDRRSGEDRSRRAARPRACGPRCGAGEARRRDRPHEDRGGRCAADRGRRRRLSRARSARRRLAR